MGDDWTNSYISQDACVLIYGSAISFLSWIINYNISIADTSSVPHPSSLEQFVQSVTGLVSEFGYGNLQPRMSSSFSMSPPPSPVDFMNDRAIGKWLIQDYN